MELSNHVREIIRMRHADALGVAMDSPLTDYPTIEAWAINAINTHNLLLSVLSGDLLPLMDIDGNVVFRQPAMEAALTDVTYEREARNGGSQPHLEDR